MAEEKEVSFSEAMDGLALFKQLSRYTEKLESVLIVASQAEGKIQSMETQTKAAEQARDKAMASMKDAVSAKEAAELDLHNFRISVAKERDQILAEKEQAVTTKEKESAETIAAMQEVVKSRQAEFKKQSDELLKRQRDGETAYKNWMNKAGESEAELQQKISDLETRLKELGSGALNALGR